MGHRWRQGQRRGSHSPSGHSTPPTAGSQGATASRLHSALRPAVCPLFGRNAPVPPTCARARTCPELLSHREQHVLAEAAQQAGPDNVQALVPPGPAHSRMEHRGVLCTAAASESTLDVHVRGAAIRVPAVARSLAPSRKSVIIVRSNSLLHPRHDHARPCACVRPSARGTLPHGARAQEAVGSLRGSQRASCPVPRAPCPSPLAGSQHSVLVQVRVAEVGNRASLSGWSPLGKQQPPCTCTVGHGWGFIVVVQVLPKCSWVLPGHRKWNATKFG